MFDSLQIAYHRLSRANTLEGALKQIIAPSLLNSSLSEVNRSYDLLEHVAKANNFDLSVLLEEVGERLELPIQRKLGLPPAAVIKKSGYKVSFLRKIPALPQYSKSAAAGWAMVVADPSAISIAEYRARGIEVVLSTGREIERVWQEYERLTVTYADEEISIAQMFAVIEQLARDAAYVGAKDVFIGHPEPGRYEFLVENKRYSGRIHPAVYHGLLKQFQEGMQFKRRSASDEFSELTFALTKNFSNLVVYLSWESRPEEKTEFENISDESSDSAELEKEAESPEQAEGDCLEDPGSKVVADSPSEDDPKKSLANESYSTSGEEPTILLVDDDLRFVGIVKKILEGKGYSVLCHHDGEAALSLLEEATERPDVIICDVHMPKMDGVDFLARLREQERDIPVLMVTSDEDDLLQVELVELGASAFVHKREDVRVLLAWCKNLTMKRSSEEGKRSLDVEVLK